MGFSHGRLPGGVLRQVVANALDSFVAPGNCVGSKSVGGCRAVVSFVLSFKSIGVGEDRRGCSVGMVR